MARRSVLIRIVNKSENCFGGNEMLDEISRYIKDDLASDIYEDEAEEMDTDLWLGLGFESDGDMPMMFETEGEISEEDGRITLGYNTALTGVFETSVKYSFDKENRSTLTVVKSSIFDEIYFFDSKVKRQVAVYGNGGNKHEMSLYTKSLKNQLTYDKGGFIEIEYYAAMNGGTVEHCREYVLVEPR